MNAAERRAPVEVSASIDVATTPDLVWSILADIEAWPDWNPAIREVSLDGPVAVGTDFRWAIGAGTLTSRLRVVAPPTHFAWKGSFMTLRHDQAWLLEPQPDGCRVDVRSRISGPLARLLSRRLGRDRQADLDAWIELLRLEAEERAAT